MFAPISEQKMHRVRWVLTCAWLLLIASLFYDPFSAWITSPQELWSPFRIKPEDCIPVQNVCLDLQPYPLGAPLFWGMIVPSAIFILLVFGHELWRRICPLSFLSQIPRALGWQRQIKRTDSKTGKVRYEIPKVKKDSWLGKNYLYLLNTDFFQSLDNEILIELSDRAYVKSYLENEHITEAGDTCRELLLLIEGNVEIRIINADQSETVSSLVSGKVLDELEVLTHTNLTGTITAKSSPTKVLAIPVDTFDDLMERDRSLAIKVLELESLRLKGLIANNANSTENFK